MAGKKRAKPTSPRKQTRQGVRKQQAQKPRRRLAERAVEYRADLPRETTHDDYLRFLEAHPTVTIEGINVQLTGPSIHSTWGPPEGYQQETSTVWSFPDRGDWATHRGNYRGNWSPYIPRNLILRYTKPGDLVLDQMCGSGTTLVEARLLGRPAIGVDANPDAVMVARDRLAFDGMLLPDTCLPLSAVKTYVGDARGLDMVQDNSVQLVATHPPYAGIVQYGAGKVASDLSAMRFNDFFTAMADVAKESLRVLAPGGHCAILMGDSRQHQHYVPISARVLSVFLDAGFILREEVIKLQWNMKATRERWGGKYNFLKIAHERLLVFRKPLNAAEVSNFRRSVKW